MDAITYIQNMDLFRQECKTKADEGNPFFSYDDETGDINYKVSKVPVIYNAQRTESACLVRLITDDEISTFESLTTVVSLGNCINKSYVFDSPESEAIYYTIRDMTPVQINGPEAGEVSFYTPSPFHGVFA